MPIVFAHGRLGQLLFLAEALQDEEKLTERLDRMTHGGLRSLIGRFTNHRL